MNSVCICSADEFTGAFIDVMWLDNRKKRFHLVDGLAAAAANITYPNPWYDNGVQSQP